MTIRGSLLARAALGSATMLCALLLPTQTSLAGTYHVYACRVPYGAQAGEPAPVEVAGGEGEEAGRWSHMQSGTALYANLCGSSGGLVASLQSGVAHADTDLATWQFMAPVGETISHATLWVAGDADGGSGYLFWLASPANPSVTSVQGSEDFISGCVYNLGCRGVGTTSEPLASVNRVVVPEANLGGSHLYINASCSSASCPSNSGDGQGHAVVVYVYAADITLEEQASPTVSEVGGELDSGGSLSGTASLYFHASDPGSGVYRALVRVDGALIQSPVIDETERCKEVSVPAEDGPAFLSATPCPGSVNGRISLDTTQLVNGSHHLLVEVTNAAGNETTVVERTIEVANGSSGSAGENAATQTLAGALAGGLLGAANGSPPSAEATLSAQWANAHGAKAKGRQRQLLMAGFGKAQTITGRLTDPGGAGIADAAIELSAKESYGGAPLVALAPAHTDANGRFTIHLAKRSPSEQLQLSYAPTIGGRPVATRTLRLRVKAALTLRVTPSLVSAGKTIVLKGRVLGGPLPPGGKQVVLEARSQGSPWLQFLVLRAGHGGRFKGSHRFRLPGPVRYRFRAVCPQEADFPFTTGASAVRSVWER